MLQSLLDGKDVSECTIIEDSAYLCGRGLLKCFVTSLANRVDVIHVVLYEVSEYTFSQGLPPHIISKLRFHDGFSDAHGWRGTNGQVTMETDLVKRLAKDDVGGKMAVVIDTLDDIILHRSAPYTCQTLHRLMRHLPGAEDADATPILALVHADLHDDVTLGVLRHTASSSIRLEPPKDSATYHYGSRSLHKRASGKVLTAHEQFTLTVDYSIGIISDVLHLIPSQPKGSAPDPTANLTFNLSLSEQEKEARSQLVLPYLRPESKAVVPTTGGSAKIFYQPDEADDFDEEDPDDDLDI